MHILFTRRGRWVLSAVAVVLLILVVFYLTHHPSLPQDVVKVECQWYQPGRHDLGVTSATTDQMKIKRILEAIGKGRLYAHPFSKWRYEAVVTITDAKAGRQQWTLYRDGSLGEWNHSRLYLAGKDLVAVLRETMPPPSTSSAE